MRVLFTICCALGWAAAQLITKSGCTCKSSSEVRWRLPGGEVGGGFSHYGCNTGPYEDRTPAQGQNWCDTQQSDCNNGQGWDFCVPSLSSKTSKGSKAAEAVNVNFGVQSQQLSQNINSNMNNNQQSGLSLNVNVNVGNGGSSAITTVQGCTCHPTSEVILMQNGVRVGGGFSHTGCGTGPYEANSPGHGSPWCDTVETWCSAGWDLCVPPTSQSSYTQLQNSYTPPLPPLPPPLQNINSFTAYSTQGAYSPAFAPTAFPMPSPTFQPWMPPPTPQPWVPPPPTPQPWVPPPTSQPWAPANPFQPFQTPAYQPAQTPAYQPAKTPSYQSPQTQQQYNAQQYPSAYLVQPPKTSTTSQKVSTPQLRSSFVSAHGSATSNGRQSRPARKGPRSGGFDYDYDDSSSSSSSSSSLLPLMLLSKGTSVGGSSSSASSLLPLMLASQGGGSSSMLPMMMMSGGFGSSGSSSNMLTQFAMLNSFRREGEGEAQDSTSLGEIGQTLGFTRAVVSKEPNSLANSTNSVINTPTQENTTSSSESA